MVRGFACFCYREAGCEESDIRVGFVTYAKELHFYNCKVGFLQYCNMHAHHIVSLETFVSLP